MSRTGHYLACFVALAVQLAFSAGNKQKSYEAAREHASETSDIFGVPLQVRATFKLRVLQDQLDGTYQYTQLSKEEYREDIQTGDFTESIVSKNGVRYVLRSRKFEPLPISYLRQLISFIRTIPDNLPVSRVTIETQSGQNVTCYLAERGPFSSEYSGYRACFDIQNAVLASWEWTFNTELHRLEYSTFLHDEKKLYPSTMRRFHNGNLLAQVNVESISHGVIDAKLLEPPLNGSRQDACNRFQPAEVDYSTEYFHIRSDYKSGSVVVIGTLDDRGKIGETEIQQSAGPKIDEAALKALKEVHVHAAKCDGRSVPSLFRLHIWFSPSLHPDSFESFR